MVSGDMSPKMYSRWRMIFLAVFIIVLAGAGLFIWQQRNGKLSENVSPSGPVTDKDTSAASFDDCKKAGNPVRQTFPEQCGTRDGKTFLNQKNMTANATPGQVAITEWGVKLKAVNTEYLGYRLEGASETPLGKVKATAYLTLSDKASSVTEECKKVGINILQLATKPAMSDAIKIGDNYYMLQVAPYTCADDTLKSLRGQIVNGITTQSIEKL